MTEFFGQDVKCEIDFASCVTAMGMQSIVRVPVLLRVMADHGVGVVVSAYPTSEDDPSDA